MQQGNVAGICEICWKYPGRLWFWCLWVEQETIESPAGDPIGFGFSASGKEARNAVWAALRANLSLSVVGCHFRSMLAKDFLAKSSAANAELQSKRDKWEELYARPAFSRCSVGKSRWYWVVSANDLDIVEDKQPLGQGMSSSPEEALKQAQEQFGAVRCVGNWLATEYRKMQIAARSMQRTTQSTDALGNDLAYYCDDGFVEPHRVVKRTAKYIFVETEPVYYAYTKGWRAYARKTFKLDRETFERTGRAVRSGRWERTYYADPSVYQAERLTASTPPCLATLKLSQNATVSQVKSAYKKLARTVHPDGGGDAEQFKQLNSAYLEALEFVENAARA